MRLSILYVAYPFAPVGTSAVGGAEQVLTVLEAGMVAAGHRCRTIACQGSTAAGALLALPIPGGQLDPASRQRHHALVKRAILAALLAEPADVIHLHGLDFAHYLPPERAARAPVLVTLHLPPEYHDAEALRPQPRHVHLQPVSERQRLRFPAYLGLLPAIPNGVPMPEPTQRVGKHRFALALGRICPEKGLHIAIDACRRAAMPLVIAGRVFPYAEHERYFRERIAPALGNGVRFVGPVSGARKRRLLAGARCLLVPSLVEETSCLVAMEALACGTAVVARPAGALLDVVEDGVTGFVADGADQMARAIARVDQIDPQRCRRWATLHGSANRMVRAQVARYHALIARHASLCQPAAIAGAEAF